MGLILTTFDVEHGSCHVIQTPNDHCLMIDAGSKAKFSPAKHLSVNWKVESLRWFTLSHHDTDHLTDIENLEKFIKPTTLERPEITKDELRKIKGAPLTSYQLKFFAFESSYNVSVPPISDSSYDWGGVQFAVFGNSINDLESPTLNNLSIVTFIDYQGWTFLFPGDLEKLGWLKLMKGESFNYWLSKTDVLIASHHGREAGYCEEIFEFFSPVLVLISDKGFSDTSVTSKYSSKVTDPGLNVHSEAIFERRKVLSTRKDGAIKISISDEGKYRIETFSTSE